MTFEPPNARESCHCGFLEGWTKRRDSPVKFDEITGEYVLECGHWAAPLYFCPHCGGKLPSRRHELFTTPSQQEIGRIQDLLKIAKSVDDVVAVLGPADEVIPWVSVDSDDEALSFENEPNRWERTHRYSSRSETLTFDVLEMPDGTIQFVWSGKYIGPNPILQQQQRPWWKFWL